MHTVYGFMYSLKVKIQLEKDGKFLISEGRAKLLSLVDKTHSLKQAAKEMSMSFRHAWGIIKKINLAAGSEIVKSERGGAKGGKTILTKLGKEILTEYENRKLALDRFLKKI